MASGSVRHDGGQHGGATANRRGTAAPGYCLASAAHSHGAAAARVAQLALFWGTTWTRRSRAVALGAGARTRSASPARTAPVRQGGFGEYAGEDGSAGCGDARWRGSWPPWVLARLVAASCDAARAPSEVSRREMGRAGGGWAWGRRQRSSGAWRAGRRDVAHHRQGSARRGLGVEDVAGTTTSALARLWPVRCDDGWLQLSGGVDISYD